MKKLLIPLVAAAALALPASAPAWGGHHRHSGAFVRLAVRTDIHAGAIAGLEKLSGTGGSFGSSPATASGSIVKSSDHPNGHFSLSLSTTWSSAQTKSFTGGSISCAPSTATTTLMNGTTSTNTYTGKTCSWTHDGTTKYAFFGKASDGTRAFLREYGTTVKGVVFKVDRGLNPGVFAGAHLGIGHQH
jgi:hypothetical protein